MLTAMLSNDGGFFIATVNSQYIQHKLKTPISWLFICEILASRCSPLTREVGMADAKLTFRHSVEIPKRRCFETLLRSVIRNTHVTWLRRFEASGRVTSVSRRGIPADSAFDWQGREQITQLHICLNLTPTKYKSGVNASSLRGFFFQRLEKFYVKKEFIQMSDRCFNTLQEQNNKN